MGEKGTPVGNLSRFQRHILTGWRRQDLRGLLAVTGVEFAHGAGVVQVFLGSNERQAGCSPPEPIEPLPRIHTL